MKRDYRQDFPLLRENPIVYLDSAATAQRPDVVIEAEMEFYKKYNANPLRGLYSLGIEATDRYEEARECVANFIHAASAKEIIFTRNATESLNLVAYSYGLSHLREGDEIVVSILEHHSNQLPWRMVAEKTGAVVKYLECDRQGHISDVDLQAAFSEKTKLVAVTQVSNVLGIKTPIDKIVALAKKSGAVVVLDAAQSTPHMEVDVQKLDVDFLAFSGHKLMAPMGIGVLYGRKELLSEMPPFLTGGEMIQTVTRDKVVYAELPHKFEAGTVNGAGAWALAAAIRYLQEVGYEHIQKQELLLTTQLMEGLTKLPYVQIQGSPDPKEHCGIVSFTIDGVHPHDVSSILDADGIAVRAGHHCAQPLMQQIDVMSTTRASMYFYNTEEDIEKLLTSVQTIRRRMGYGE
ncbi:cysteine desulfurase [Kineothrix sp. MSJ-39]|uniref:aminotransferase class V-fold PLP-dependent enzyme n=1 Tax=Kineothrix sp. MSJ-39 TaxID=2841533 RepID=UPI001C12707A|nr:cysteine desulfurase [Kineothrix sp. MSJ-39]MBU5429306.1 cysteine desulfurase [Kineothrix sp. MSJ-39]